MNLIILTNAQREQVDTPKVQGRPTIVPAASASYPLSVLAHICTALNCEPDDLNIQNINNIEFPEDPED